MRDIEVSSSNPRGDVVCQEFLTAATCSGN